MGADLPTQSAALTPNAALAEGEGCPFPFVWWCGVGRGSWLLRAGRSMVGVLWERVFVRRLTSLLDMGALVRDAVPVAFTTSYWRPAMGVGVEQQDAMVAHAEALGREAGEAAGKWADACCGLNPARARVALASVLRGDFSAGGLPHVPDLSGEWADEPTPSQLATAVGGELGVSVDADLADALCSAWEAGVQVGYAAAAEASLRELAQWWA